MRYFAFLGGVSSLFLAQTTLSQRITTTQPWANGNTEVLSVSTDALGDLLTVTVSTITADAGLPTTATTALTTPVVKTTAPTTITTRTKAGAATTTGPDTTTGLRVVGQDTTAPPMQTTTYYYDPGDGTWTYATWTASVTGAPSVATANVPAGTVQSYNQYQSTINSVVLASAEAAAATVSGQTGAARRSNNGVTGWAAMGVGAVGAAVGVLVL